MADSFYTMPVNTGLNVGTETGLLAGVSDPDGDPLNLTILSAPVAGTATVNADGSFNYTPTADFAGNDGFVYQVDDGHGGAASATVWVQVLGPLTANDTSYTIRANEMLIGNLSANEAGGWVTASLLQGPTNGTADVNGGGGFTYTPNAGFTGNDSFVYQVDDGHGSTASATVHIDVTADSAPEGSAPSLSLGAGLNSPTTQVQSGAIGVQAPAAQPITGHTDLVSAAMQEMGHPMQHGPEVTDQFFAGMT